LRLSKASGSGPGTLSTGFGGLIGLGLPGGLGAPVSGSLKGHILIVSPVVQVADRVDITKDTPSECRRKIGAPVTKHPPHRRGRVSARRL